MRQYFKGYYFKCCMGDETIAFIPALHRSKQHRKGQEGSASLQIITKQHVYFIPYDTIIFGKGSLKIKVGSSYFSEKGICLDVDTKECQIHGKLKFGRMQKPKYSIMGPFQYLPYMQCKHSVVSMRHMVSGNIVVNGKNYHDVRGIGYVEGDRGSSFPKEYLWTQCHFCNDSVMLSVAEIPFCGFVFRGIIGIVLINGKEYRIATYLGAKVNYLGNRKVIVRQGKYTLTAKLIEEAGKGLKAPVNGEMARTIQESICCKAWYRFTVGDEILLEFTSESASFEYMY